MRIRGMILTTAAILLVAGSAHAAQGAVCSVAVTATHDGAVVETYATDFTVAPDAPFIDDFSTPTREKEFRARLMREDDGVKVHISYFSDLGAFHAASFDADMLVAAKPRTTSGGTGFFLSSSDVPVGGTHQIRYTLTCER